VQIYILKTAEHIFAENWRKSYLIKYIGFKMVFSNSYLIHMALQKKMNNNHQ